MASQRQVDTVGRYLRDASFDLPRFGWKQRNSFLYLFDDLIYGVDRGLAQNGVGKVAAVHGAAEPSAGNAALADAQPFQSQTFTLSHGLAADVYRQEHRRGLSVYQAQI